jgi:hypothetical protein
MRRETKTILWTFAAVVLFVFIIVLPLVYVAIG